MRISTFQQVQLIESDVLIGLQSLSTASIDVVLGSPDYYYQVVYPSEGQDGLEPTFREYLARKRLIARELFRVVKDGGVCCLVVGDTQNNYSPVYGSKKVRSGQWDYRRPLQDGYIEAECLYVPARIVDVFRSVGWKFIGSLTWEKPGSSKTTLLGNANSESILFFVRQTKGRRTEPNQLVKFENSVLKYPTVKKSKHRCPYPKSLTDKLLSHLVKPRFTVLDPWIGSGTTALSALEYGCSCIGIDLDTSLAEKIFSAQTIYTETNTIQTVLPVLS